MAPNPHLRCKNENCTAGKYDTSTYPSTGIYTCSLCKFGTDPFCPNCGGDFIDEYCAACKLHLPRRKTDNASSREPSPGPMQKLPSSNKRAADSQQDSSSKRHQKPTPSPDEGAFAGRVPNFDEERDSLSRHRHRSTTRGHVPLHDEEQETSSRRHHKSTLQNLGALADRDTNFDEEPYFPRHAPPRGRGDSRQDQYHGSLSARIPAPSVFEASTTPIVDSSRSSRSVTTAEPLQISRVSAQENEVVTQQLQTYEKGTLDDPIDLDMEDTLPPLMHYLPGTTTRRDQKADGWSKTSRSSRAIKEAIQNAEPEIDESIFEGSLSLGEDSPVSPSQSGMKPVVTSPVPTNLRTANVPRGTARSPDNIARIVSMMELPREWQPADTVDLETAFRQRTIYATKTYDEMVSSLDTFANKRDGPQSCLLAWAGSARSGLSMRAKGTGRQLCPRHKDNKYNNTGQEPCVYVEFAVGVNSDTPHTRKGEPVTRWILYHRPR